MHGRCPSSVGKLLQPCTGDWYEIKKCNSVANWKNNIIHNFLKWYYPSFSKVYEKACIDYSESYA